MDHLHRQFSSFYCNFVLSGCFQGWAWKPIHQAALDFRVNCWSEWLFAFLFGKMPSSNKALSQKPYYAWEVIDLEIVCIVPGMAGTLGIKAFGRWI